MSRRQASHASELRVERGFLAVPAVPFPPREAGEKGPSRREQFSRKGDLCAPGRRATDLRIICKCPVQTPPRPPVQSRGTHGRQPLTRGLPQNPLPGISSNSCLNTWRKSNNYSITNATTDHQGFSQALTVLERRLREPTPSRLQLLFGPRHLINQGKDVFCWREEPWEVDAMVPGIRQIIEVKSGPFTAEDLRGLTHAAGRFPDFKPLVVCDSGQERQAEAAGFEGRSWKDFLLGDL